MPHATPEEVRRAFTDAGHGNVADELIAGSRPGVAILREVAEEDAIPIGASKLGGRPDLPAAAAWPARDGRPLAFIGQIDLAGVPDVEPSLPRSGLVLFFYDAVNQPWGFDLKDKGAAHVVYVPPGAALKRTDPAMGAYSDEPEYDKPFASCAVRFEVVTTYPDLGPSLIEREDADEVLDLVSELVRAGQGEDDEPRHQLRGHPLLLQNPMEIECQLVSNGIYCGGGDIRAADRRRAAQLERGAKDWTLLLQVDTDDSAGWMWGDVGMLYFWIRHEDIARADFSKVWCILQCG